jgi:effector-binding domain-containing protein
MDYNVTIREVVAEQLASVRDTYPMARLPEAMPGEFGRVMAALVAEGIQPAGGAVAIYHGWTEDAVDVEIGFTIRGVFFPQDPHGRVKASRIPGGRALSTLHMGPYSGLVAAYEAVQNYAAANGLELAGNMWERYLTDPAVEPDLSKHVTEIYWPIG